MAPGNYSPSGEFDDVNSEGYVSGPVSVTAVAVEAKVGASRLYGREVITITNNGPKTVYYGPSGVTASGAGVGDKLYKDQFVSLSIGDGIGVFVICGAGETATVTVQEQA
jgi:hypothetical protein